MSNLSVIIPTYRGRDLLMRYLPFIEEAIGGEGEIVVVDDASTDDTVNALQDRFPQVKIVARQSNGGFSKSVNDGILATSGEFVVLLNNDVEVSPDFLQPLLPLFDDETVFSVSPAVILPNADNLDEGAKTGRWHHGMFFSGQRQGVRATTPVLYATGCAAIYRRSMLESLGGFDEAYSPFYYEDADLGYRAWKRGWRSIYQPTSTVYHQHFASISKIPADVVSRVKSRNSLFFIWRNMEDAKLVRAHRLWLPLVLARRAAAGDAAFVKGWRDAFDRRTEAATALRGDSTNRRLSDAEIFQITGSTAA